VTSPSDHRALDRIADRPKHGEPSQYHFPRFEQHQLSNGLGLLSVHLPGRELVTASLALPSGAVDEPSDQAASPPS
jgi:secreted Zn-dependent insulinase-like peptidase